MHECTRGCVDKNDAVWEALDKLAFSPFKHANGNAIRAKAISIDSGDGNTNDAVYSWVRTRSARHPHVRVMAVKGSSERQDPEIFATPRLKSIDHHRPDKQTKADRHGVKVCCLPSQLPTRQ
uniref:Phage terminase large subunit (GpA) n=1 Tax=Candidatus Kentrum eta TaxID=2126337 RepID=A0A450V3H5_9GAMM|nr:MAG: Phage terminase large subunit (GpA) [Candidatus Kentron sp. H]VFJ99340.1 MAG: Phage terminase large subunit (GpA) [Candidatus Kentron sp. H]